ncbi:MAG: ergothioneine biosynthesis protein EgtB [Candidatus Eisenbacteria bacterium]|nr:ergothioneine biosynthesis protein EgtB [Candidatus Eisenbacteria bacterium]
MLSYDEVRRTTEALADPLTPEDCMIQSMPDVSPTKWHLAHTTWFFETFVLARAISGYDPFHPQYRYLYNSYYNTVGEQYPRPRRGLLSRPSLDEVKAYREHVDRKMRGLGAQREVGEDSLGRIIELGLHHEQQHQELLLTDIKHVFGCNPLHPVYAPAVPGGGTPSEPMEWFRYDEGLHQAGHEGASFAYDNETPRHRVYLRAFELASRPVTNGEFLQFIRDGGYRDPRLWLSDGWAFLHEHEIRAPLYWEERDGVWYHHTLNGYREIDPDEPVCHISYYEADAYAAWVGARLPAEAEWELAAAAIPQRGNLLESKAFHPSSGAKILGEAEPVATAALAGGALEEGRRRDDHAPAGAQSTTVVEPDGPRQLFGDVWEWTRSPYTPYPGYRAPGGAIGEYNGKFMSGQMVLRGGSCVTPATHIRATYRNFFPPDARWQFSGLRLARDPS